MSDESSWRVFRCPRCHEPFPRRDHLALHRGRRHGGELEPDEQEAFAVALAAEESALARLRVHVRAGFAVLPIALFFLFAMVMLMQLGGNVGFLIIVVPGFVGFSALVYAMVISRAEYHRIEAEKAAAVGGDADGSGASGSSPGSGGAADPGGHRADTRRGH